MSATGSSRIERDTNLVKVSVSASAACMSSSSTSTNPDRDTSRIASTIS